MWTPNGTSTFLEQQNQKQYRLPLKNFYADTLFFHKIFGGIGYGDWPQLWVCLVSEN